MFLNATLVVVYY